MSGLYSMTSFGAVAARDDLADTYYAELKPLPDASVNPEKADKTQPRR